MVRTDFPTRPSLYGDLEEVINDALSLENSIKAALNQTEPNEALLQELNEKVSVCYMHTITVSAFVEYFVKFVLKLQFATEKRSHCLPSFGGKVECCE